LAEFNEQDMTMTIYSTGPS